MLYDSPHIPVASKRSPGAGHPVALAPVELPIINGVVLGVEILYDFLKKNFNSKESKEISIYINGPVQRDGYCAALYNFL